MAIVRRGHYADPLDFMSREFDRLMGRYFGEAEVPAVLAPYPVDVREDENCIYVEAELPGFKTNEVEITLENGVLTIRAERKVEDHGGKGQPLQMERRWTQFQRSFSLPTAVDENSVKAELDNGVLRLTMNKREEVKPKRITVSASNGGKQQLEPGKQPAEGKK